MQNSTWYKSTLVSLREQTKELLRAADDAKADLLSLGYSPDSAAAVRLVLFATDVGKALRDLNA